MRTMSRTLTALALTGLFAAGLSGAPAQAAHEELVVTGLAQNGKLVTFLAGSGERLTQSKKISGVAAGEELVGIDYRPSNNALYGVTTDGSTGRVVLVDPATASVSYLEGLSFPITGDVSIDFNPAVDRLRVVSTDEFSYAVTTVPNGLITRNGDIADAARDDADVAVAAVAYLNNDNDAATGTTLFDVDAADDALYTQNAAAGTLTRIGALGTDLGLDSGLDIYTEVVGGTVRNIALLADRDADGSRVYTVNLTTGAVNRSATSGVLVQGAPLLDIAVDTAQ